MNTADIHGMKRKTIAIRYDLPDERYERLKHLAKVEKRSVSSQAALLLESCLESIFAKGVQSPEKKEATK